MKIGILGSGNVAKALGSAFIALQHDVKLGSREPQKLKEWREASGPNALAGTFAEAAQFGEIVVLATLGVATANAIELAGKGHFSGKLVIDTTNPLDFSSGGPRLSVGHSDSGGEQIQRAIPDARVVKCFNTVGAPHMFKPDFKGGPPDMFICGNDEGAKKKMAELLHEFGWNTVDIGGIDGSRHLEPMCMVWVLSAMKAGTWNQAFKLLKK